MEKDKLIDVINNIENTSNKDLFSAIDLLNEEFENTKQLLIDITKHLDTVEEYYNLINKEIEKRHKEL
jgi:predicted RND superfamily exporter protein